MEDNQEQPQEEVIEEAVEEVVEEVTEEVEQPEKDRPEENYKAELARKNAEIARLRAEADARNHPTEERKRDPADISTWSDNELKMLKNSNDPSVAAYKEQADELLLERRVKAIQAKEYETRRREETKAKLEAEYPEALDSTSEFSQKVEKVMREYDLSRTPAGRLVAAKIVASEGKASKAKGQTKEERRVAHVKGQMVDGDRPKPTDAPKDLDTKRKNLADKLMDTRNSNGQTEALGDILKDRGLTRDKFFKR